MKYLLDEDEFKALTAKAEVASRDETLKIARQMILDASGYKCWRDQRTSHDGYCDFCPISKISDCPSGTPDRERQSKYQYSKLLCTLPRDYSK